MDRVLDVILFFKDTNFTVKKEFLLGSSRIREYVYNMKRYLTDVWPPNLLAGGREPPICSVVRDDGVDITRRVMKFSGPRRNYIHPLSLHVIKKKPKITFKVFGVSVTLVDVPVPYEGSFTVTTSLGKKSVIKMTREGIIKNGDEARVSA